MIHSETPEEEKPGGLDVGNFGGQGISVLLEIRRLLNFTFSEGSQDSAWLCDKWPYLA